MEVSLAVDCTCLGKLCAQDFSSQCQPSLHMRPRRPWTRNCRGWWAKATEQAARQPKGWGNARRKTISSGAAPCAHLPLCVGSALAGRTSARHGVRFWFGPIAPPSGVQRLTAPEHYTVAPCSRSQGTTRAAIVQQRGMMKAQPQAESRHSKNGERRHPADARSTPTTHAERPSRPVGPQDDARAPTAQPRSWGWPSTAPRSNAASREEMPRTPKRRPRPLGMASHLPPTPPKVEGAAPHKLCIRSALRPPLFLVPPVLVNTSLRRGSSASTIGVARYSASRSAAR